MQIPIKAEIELKEDSKGFRKLVALTARALGWVGEPLHKFLNSKAEASAIVTRARAEAEAEDIRYIAALRRDHLERRRTKNIQAIVQQTMPLLTNDVSDDAVGDDWAIHFFEEVQDVSDSEMQMLWSRILAGEIAEPQTFSIRTLNFLKSLRKQEAEDFAEICRLVCTLEDDFPLLVDADSANQRHFSRGKGFSGIQWHLQNIGLISADSILDARDVLKHQIKYFDEIYRFTDPNGVTSQGLQHIMGLNYLTMTGAELYQVASPKKIDGYACAIMDEVAKELRLEWERVQ